MEYRELGRTGEKVSVLALGTMTYGEQNSEAEGHAQMDYVVERGINLFDASEIYPIPPKPDTQGRTEAIIGSWLASRKTRDKVLIATKVAGRGKMTWLRKDGSLTRQNEAQIVEAVDASLARLKSDHIDLYQLHWPDRPMRIFEGHDYVHLGEEERPIQMILGTLGKLVDAGKVRFIGLSNETSWGVMTFLKCAELHGLPRIVSVQNAYNLVNRSFETGLSEIFYREHVSLLTYFAARPRLSQRQVRGWSVAARLAQDAVRPARPLRDGERLARDLNLCRARAEAWPRPGADGDRVRRLSALRDEHDHWGHDLGAAQDRHRRRGLAPPRRSACGHRADPP